ncbi:MAG: hypothetical protein LBK76_10970 [Verrucomicrobiales bacterium]|jgi:hypothetical protein|nr:hypothetical protein [Verrucomicrobiales bacterium]
MNERKNFWRRLALTVTLALPAGAVSAAQPPAQDTDEVWRLDTIYAFTDANRLVTRLGKAGHNDREFLFAKAATMLNDPTKTQGNIDAAAAVFQQLADADADDDIGVSARYFLARVLQTHMLLQPDKDADGAAIAANQQQAIGLYRALFGQHPEHNLAQLGYLRAVTLELYNKTSSEPMAARLKRLSAERPQFADPQMEKNYHLILAQPYLLFNVSKEQALAHYVAADRLGFRRWQTQCDLYVVISDLALELGRRDLAAQYCVKFLQNFPRDDRNYTIRERLAKLQGVSVDQIAVEAVITPAPADGDAAGAGQTSTGDAK